MKKSFLKVSGLAGLMLLGGLTMVSCYEGDDDKIDYVVPEKEELPAPKYYLYYTVEDADGNALDADVTVFFGTTQVSSQTGSASSLDVTTNGAGLYSLTAKKDGYATVSKPAQQMFEAAKGSTGILTFTVVMKKLSEESGYGVPDVTNEAVTEETMASVKTSVVDYLKTAIQGSENEALMAAALENVTTSAVIVDEVLDGKTKKQHSTLLTIPVRFEESQRTANYFSLAGYKVASEPKAVKATDPVAAWKEQANLYFNVKSEGFSLVKSSTTLDAPAAGMRLIGYDIEMAIVSEDLTFECGEDKAEYTGTTYRPVGSVNVKAIYVNKTPEKDEIVNEEISEETKEEVAKAVEEAYKEVAVEGVTVETENIETTATTVEIEVNGVKQEVAAVNVTIPMTSDEITKEKEIVVKAPISTGYACDESSIKATKAIDPKEEWIEQANAYFGVAAPGMKLITKDVTLSNPNGYPVKGFKVTETFIIRKLTFLCGEDLVEYEGTVKHAVGSAEVKNVYVDDSHDDSHDDHHTNGGTSYGGGTTSGN